MLNTTFSVLLKPKLSVFGHIRIENVRSNLKILLLQTAVTNNIKLT